MCECTAERCLILLLHQPNTEASGPAPAGSRSSRIGGQSLGLPIFYGRLPSRCLWLGLALGSPNPSTVDSELGSPEDCPGPAPVDSAPAAKAPESGRLGVREPAVASGAPNPWREKRTPKKTMCECTAGRCLILLLHQPNTEASEKNSKNDGATWWRFGVQGPRTCQSPSTRELKRHGPKGFRAHEPVRARRHGNWLFSSRVTGLTGFSWALKPLNPVSFQFPCRRALTGSWALKPLGPCLFSSRVDGL